MVQRLGGSKWGSTRGFSMGNVLGLRPQGLSVGVGPSFANSLFSRGTPRVHGRFFMGRQNRGMMSTPSFWGRYHALKGGVAWKGIR